MTQAQQIVQKMRPGAECIYAPIRKYYQVWFMGEPFEIADTEPLAWLAALTSLAESNAEEVVRARWPNLHIEHLRSGVVEIQNYSQDYLLGAGETEYLAYHSAAQRIITECQTEGLTP